MILTLILLAAAAKIAFILADMDGENATDGGAERTNWPSHPYRF
jgi:hypothetical protein